jgi:hypothetical protein
MGRPGKRGANRVTQKKEREEEILRLIGDKKKIYTERVQKKLTGVREKSG